MTWRGAFSGALMLIALESVVRTRQSASRVGSFLENVGDLVRLAMSPAVPLIRDRRSIGEALVEDNDDFKQLDSNGWIPGG